MNGGKYWIVARVARKWLAVPETSIPSESVLSIRGLVDTAERLNLLGVSIREQVFLYKNTVYSHIDKVGVSCESVHVIGRVYLIYIVYRI